MLIYLDTNIVVYLIEQPAIFGQLALARAATILTNGDQIAVSDLHRLECRVAPLMQQNQPRLTQFDAFFGSGDVRVLPLSRAVCERAGEIRAGYRLRPQATLLAEDKLSSIRSMTIRPVTSFMHA